MKFPVFLATALIIAAGAAQAQTTGYPAAGPAPGAPMPSQAQYGGGMGGCGHTAAITDEYGFRYDSEGNRLNAQGCVIAPPVTPPGAAAYQGRR
jgi:hypothetical protein